MLSYEIYRLHHGPLRWQVFFHQRDHRWSVAGGHGRDHADCERRAFNEIIRRCPPIAKIDGQPC